MHVISPRRGARTLNRYGHGLGFFDDLVEDFSGGWEDFGDPGAEFGDTFDDFSAGDFSASDYYPDLVDYGGDDVLSVDDYVMDVAPEYFDPADFSPVALDTPLVDYGGDDVLSVDEYVREVAPEYLEPADVSTTPSNSPGSLPGRPPLSTGGPGGLLSTVFGAATQATARRIDTGGQMPGTVYLPGVRPGMVQVPGQPNATRYPTTAPGSTVPIGKKIESFIKANPIPLAIGAGLLMFAVLAPRKSRR